MPRTILVTGGTGFLGSNLIRRLLQTDTRVVLLKRSFSNTHRLADVFSRLNAYDLDKIELKEVFSRERIDMIAHCATDYGRKEVSSHAVIEANLVLPLRLLETGIEAGVKVFLNTDTILDKRMSKYSLSKKQFSEWLETFSDQLIPINFALEHFYGPGDDSSKFVARMVQEMARGEPRIDLTPGDQRRDFIFIDDVIDALELVLQKAPTFGSNSMHRFEVGSGDPISIRSFMATLQEVSQNTKTELKWGAIPYRENEVMNSVVNTASLRTLGWHPKTSLREGLQKTLQSEKAKMA